MSNPRIMIEDIKRNALKYNPITASYLKKKKGSK
jgi:hypothetical protein